MTMTVCLPAADTREPCPDTAYEAGILLLQSASQAEYLVEAVRWIESAARRGHRAAQQLCGDLAPAAAA